MIEIPVPVSDTNGSHPDDVLDVILHQYGQDEPIRYGFNFEAQGGAEQ